MRQQRRKRHRAAFQPHLRFEIAVVDLIHKLAAAPARRDDPGIRADGDDPLDAAFAAVTIAAIAACSAQKPIEHGVSMHTPR